VLHAHDEQLSWRRVLDEVDVGAKGAAAGQRAAGARDPVAAPGDGAVAVAQDDKGDEIVQAAKATPIAAILNAMSRSLQDPFDIGGVRVPNRVVLAPLAGIGNWFVRLQAKRHGAGLAVSEMISSFAVHHGNRRTHEELLRVHPAEREGGPVAMQLFGQEPAVMRSAAEQVAAAGADLIDLNMGCPVPKVMKTGAGAALLRDHDTAVAVARAAREGSNLPVTVKLRAGQRPGERDGIVLAHRLVEEAGVAAIAFHPRSANVRHAGTPDYALAAQLAAELPVPVLLSGGLRDAEHVRAVFEATGVAAVMLARGSLGNPWLFGELLGLRAAPPTHDEIVAEWAWVIDRAQEHLGADRAARYLRTFHPWYVDRLGAGKAVQNALQRAETLARQRSIIASLRPLKVA
jgi:tRNA-dihydrouridine synthase B